MNRWYKVKIGRTRNYQHDNLVFLFCDINVYSNEDTYIDGDDLVPSAVVAMITVDDGPAGFLSESPLNALLNVIHLRWSQDRYGPVQMHLFICEIIVLPWH